MDKKLCLLSIDPQVDFCDPKGNLYVKGAEKDMARLAKMVEKHGDDIDDIQVTMDSHYHYHIAHACFTVDIKGNHPSPFTVITEDDIKNGKWRAYDPARQQWLEHYVHELAANKRYMLMIWPDHCIIGSPGQCIDPDFLKAITDWETRFFAIAPRTTKGSNPFTENYSVVKADVEYPGDTKTKLNSKFIDTLKTYDTILISGEALSHCVNFTITDVAEEFSEEQVKKFVLLEDACSSVGGCEKLGEDFVNRMVAKGMQVSKTDKFFA